MFKIFSTYEGQPESNEQQFFINLNLLLCKNEIHRLNP